MRLSHLMIVAGAGLGICIVGAHRAEAMTGTSPAAARAALPEINLAEPVHCRPYLHRHGFRLTRGCSVVIVQPRRSHVIVRDGVRVREGVSTSIRSTTTTRSGTTTVRGSSGSVSGAVQSSGSGGSVSGSTSGGAGQTTTSGGAGAKVGGSNTNVGGSVSGGASTSTPGGQ